jgi:hypothetical protein
MSQLTEPLLLDPQASVVAIDCKPGGGEMFHKLRDFCFAYGLIDRLDVLDFSNQQFVTGFAPMMPNGLIPTAHAKKVRSVFRAGVGQNSFDNTRQLSKFMFIGLYASRLLEMDLVEAWEILLPGSRLRKKILPKIADPFLQRELQYIESLSPSRQDQLLSSSIALLEQVIADAYIRPFLTHRPSINIKDALQKRRHIFINMGHDAPISIDDVRILARMAVNEVITSVFANKGRYGPTYLILDECHLTLSRDICLALDTGRSLGLRCFLIHQYLGQLREEDGSHLLYDSVMSSGRIKILFGGLSTADLEVLEKETRIGEVDIYKRKHTLYGLETHQHETTREIVTSGISVQHTTSRARSASETDTTSEAVTSGTNTSVTRSTEDSRGTSIGAALHEMDSVARTRGRSRSRGKTDMTSVTNQENWHAAESDASHWAHAENTAQNWNQVTSAGSGTNASIGYTLPAFGGGFPDQYDYSFGNNTSQAVASGAGGARALVHTAGGSRATMRGVGGAHALITGHATMTAETNSEAETLGTSRGRTNSQTAQQTHSDGLAVQFGQNEQVTDGASHALTRGLTATEGRSVGANRSVSVTPFHEVSQQLRASNIEYVSREEQAIQHIQQMKYRPTAHCMLSVPMKPAAFFHFDWKQPVWIPERLRNTCQERVYTRPYHARCMQHGDVIEVEAREVGKPQAAALPTAGAVVAPAPVGAAEPTTIGQTRRPRI